MSILSFRRNLLSRPIYRLARKALPGLSNTEREALSAGDVWWDGELFSGNPDWQQLLQTPPASLSEEEQVFLEGPVNQLCQMLDEWEINHRRGDLPKPVWDFLKQQRFFAMIIPKVYGGLEFSKFANSEVIRRIASRSVVAAVTVMVPNSLGPGELLMEYGTDQQREYWLPRLADGRELPCFSLTSTPAGSDAASMQDHGVVCRGEFEGEETLGIRLNWEKRYITLGPVATVLGLAFKLSDPEQLLGEQTERGITVALVPAKLPGVEIGRRHLPAQHMFLNGPNEGKDVFIPLDMVIGGAEQIGKGWRMLMSALAAGRGVSLPSLSAAATAFSARTSGAYARIRQQFGIPIGLFEGIQERLAPLAADCYRLDAARRLTCAGLDAGHNLAVISAIMKVHATYLMRSSIDHAMDIHAGKAIIDGPRNYLGDLYRAVPIGITVEGANILTRSMIVFGQGAIRCHPWLLKEMLALEESDSKKALQDFDQSFWKHVAHGFKTFGRTWLRSWSGGLLGPAPEGTDKKYFRQLGRYAAGFALLSEAALLLLGGGLKRREMISARLGDVLSELFLLSAVLKRWREEGQPEEDWPLVEYCMQSGLVLIENRLSLVLSNLPMRPLVWVLGLFILPLGARRKGPSDRLTRKCAELLLEPSEARDRLTQGLFLAPGASSSVANLERAFELVTSCDSLHKKLKQANCSSVEKALELKLISEEDAERLREEAKAVAEILAVDDFAPEDLGESNFTPSSEHPSQGEST